MTQIIRYLENNDASSISYKQFNQLEVNKYPTFSVCLKGTKLYFKKMETQIFKQLKITGQEYEDILKGKQGIRYEYNSTSRLYKRIPLDIEELQDIDFGIFEALTFNFSDIVWGLEFATEDTEHKFRYPQIKGAMNKGHFPFTISYQTPETICYTRNSNDRRGLLRTYDWISLKTNVLKDPVLRTTELKIIVHYPGQLLRSMQTPNFLTSFNDLSKASAVYEGTTLKKKEKLQELNIEQVTVLKKRTDSNAPCSEEILDDDTHLLKEMIKRIGCIPMYWRWFDEKDSGFGECKTALELERAYHYIENYKDVLKSYRPPCVDMEVLTTSSSNLPLEDSKNHIDIKLTYTKQLYQEIVNQRDFSFESFWSSVGGFIGIFLGYSILQVPDLVTGFPCFNFC